MNRGIKSGCLSFVAILLATVPAFGRTIPDAGNPVAFFTTIADKMLRSTFAFGVTNIPVYSNGVYVYTPAVQRLLQFSANLYDANNTNFFPVVFRPLLGRDVAGNIFIVGYAQVTGVTGPDDPQLSRPYDVSQLTGAATALIADANGPVNVYGVPWIIGAKKGLPNLNQLSLLTAATFTRKLQFTRSSLDPATATYATNQMYVMSIGNSLGISFWNSYASAYPRPVAVHASDTLSLKLTNGIHEWTQTTNFTLDAAVTLWPGGLWTGNPPYSSPAAQSFLTNSWTSLLLSSSAYDFNSGAFDPTFQWQSTSPPLPALPTFGLAIANCLQAFILDGTNVIDYVQLNGLNGDGNLNQALADNNYPDISNQFLQWSTNCPPSSTTPYGVINQIWVSLRPQSAPLGGSWTTAPTPMGMTTPAAEAAYFLGFFAPSFQYQGANYVNTLQTMQAPYTPSRTVYSSFLLQANDPLVHYLASDLNSQNGALSVWGNNKFINGTWYHSDDLLIQPMPVTPITPIGGRFQPWLRKGQMDVYPIDQVIPVTNNYGVRDPLVYEPDYWNFPSNVLCSLSCLGQVHRGTPWQTFYLKDADFLKNIIVSGTVTNYVGTNTWALWTGDLDTNDAALMAPGNDRQLAGLLMSLLNTNDPTHLFSVNDADPAAWENLLGGFTVYSNSRPFVAASSPVTFTTSLLDSNSAQAAIIANGILQAQTNGYFYSIGDVFACSALSAQSPFLNLGGSQKLYGITDWEYEAIPAQLLPLLRPDSIGALTASNSILSFSGADGYSYVLQTSTNLSDWISLSTNFPQQGRFTAAATWEPSPSARFYRSLLLP
jgi:hypothetical protein